MQRFTALAATLAAGALVPAHAALFGVAGFSSFGIQSLYAIDAATGAATLVGSTGLRQISGLEWDSANNRLVALNALGDQYVINTGTGASTLLASGSYGVPEGSIAFSGGSTYTTLFDNLNTWNGTGWTEIGNSGLAAGADISGLASGGGRMLGLALNGSGSDQIVSFNTTTGAATVIGATGTNATSVAGFTYAFIGGEWFMTNGASLFSVNADTGAASLIGSHGVSGFSGLAFVPAPGAAALLGLGVLIAVRRRN